MLGVAPELIAKHEHRMLVHAGTDLLEGVGVGRGPEIDGAHLGDERRMKLAKCQAADAHVSLGSRFAAAKQAHTSWPRWTIWKAARGIGAGRRDGINP